MLVPYLNNPSEEAIFESNKIKEGHETMALQNEEVMLKIHIYFFLSRFSFTYTHDLQDSRGRGKLSI